MSFYRNIMAGLFAAFALVTYGHVHESLTDPYQIYQKHYEAIGGLDKVKAEKTSYFEGTFTMAGLQGTIRQWAEVPIRKRTEVDLKVVKQTMGDNGRFSWVVDPNGKVQIERDEVTIRRREVEGLLAIYDHLNRDSDHFRLTFEGISEVGAVDCYVVKIANNIDENIRLEYFDTSSYYLQKSVAIETDREIHILYSDFREADGIIRASRQEIEILPIGHKQTIQVTQYQSNLEIESSLFEPPQKDVQDFQFLDGESAEDVSFQYIANHLFILVKINCEERLWCLDTGASVTVIDSDYASELGLELEGNLKGYGARSTVELSLVTIPSYSIQGIQFNEQRVAAIDISGLFEKGLGLEVAGVLGYDFLSRFVTKVDYANEKLSFYHPERFRYQGEGEVFDTPTKDRLFQVAMTVDGRYSGDWCLDIGAGGMSFYYPFAEENGLLDIEGIEGLAGGAGGYHNVRVSEFQSIEFAGYTVEKPLISIPLQKGGAFGSREGIGNAGNNLFRHFVLYFDYEHQQVIVEKGRDFDREFPRDKSGLQLWLSEDDSVEVMFVSPDTPAEEAGFKEGDTIQSINGIGVGYLDGLIAIRELLREEAGTEYRFGVLRNGEKREIELELQDLF